MGDEVAKVRTLNTAILKVQATESMLEDDSRRETIEPLLNEFLQIVRNIPELKNDIIVVEADIKKILENLAADDDGGHQNLEEFKLKAVWDWSRKAGVTLNAAYTWDNRQKRIDVSAGVTVGEVHFSINFNDPPPRNNDGQGGIV